MAAWTCNGWGPIEVRMPALQSSVASTTQSILWSRSADHRLSLCGHGPALEVQAWNKKRSVQIPSEEVEVPCGVKSNLATDSIGFSPCLINDSRQQMQRVLFPERQAAASHVKRRVRIGLRSAHL